MADFSPIEHVQLLGDQTIAAMWLPFARRKFRALDRSDDKRFYKRLALQDAVITMRRTGKVRTITIEGIGLKACLMLHDGLDRFKLIPRRLTSPTWKAKPYTGDDEREVDYGDYGWSDGKQIVTWQPFEYAIFYGGSKVFYYDVDSDNLLAFPSAQYPQVIVRRCWVSARILFAALEVNEDFGATIDNKIQVYSFALSKLDGEWVAASPSLLLSVEIATDVLVETDPNIFVSMASSPSGKTVVIFTLDDYHAITLGFTDGDPSATVETFAQTGGTSTTTTHRDKTTDGPGWTYTETVDNSASGSWAVLAHWADPESEAYEVMVMDLTRARTLDFTVTNPGPGDLSSGTTNWTGSVTATADCSIATPWGDITLNTDNYDWSATGTENSTVESEASPYSTQWEYEYAEYFQDTYDAGGLRSAVDASHNGVMLVARQSGPDSARAFDLYDGGVIEKTGLSPYLPVNTPHTIATTNPSSRTTINAFPLDTSTDTSPTIKATPLSVGYDVYGSTFVSLGSISTATFLSAQLSASTALHYASGGQEPSAMFPGGTDLTAAFTNIAPNSGK